MRLREVSFAFFPDLNAHDSKPARPGHKLQSDSNPVSDLLTQSLHQPRVLPVYIYV